MIARTKPIAAIERSRNGGRARTKPLRCIHIGCKPNSRGSGLNDFLRDRADQFQLVALVDLTRKLALAEGKRLAMPTLECFGSLDEALRDVVADAAIITSPTRLHAEHIQTCLEAGLHVFTAKPMACDLDEAVRLVELAESRNLCLVVDQQQRFLETERVAAEWVRTKKFGEVGFVSFNFHRYRPDPHGITNPHPFLWQQGVHSFNSLLAMLGRPALSVHGHEFKPPWSIYKGATIATGEIEFEGKLPCQFFGSFESRGFSVEFRLECERATVRLVSEESTWHKHIEVALPGQPFQKTAIKDRFDLDRPEGYCFDAFYRGCTEGGRVTNDGRDNLQTLAIVDAFIRSSQSDRRETVRAFSLGSRSMDRFDRRKLP